MWFKRASKTTGGALQFLGAPVQFENLWMVGKYNTWPLQLCELVTRLSFGFWFTYWARLYPSSEKYSLQYWTQKLYAYMTSRVVFDTVGLIGDCALQDIPLFFTVFILGHVGKPLLGSWRRLSARGRLPFMVRAVAESLSLAHLSGESCKLKKLVELFLPPTSWKGKKAFLCCNISVEVTGSLHLPQFEQMDFA